MTALSDIVKVALVIILCLAFLYSSYVLSGTINIPVTNDHYIFPEVKANSDPWYDRVVRYGEYEATDWINEYTNKSDKFVADIFGAELIMGMTTRVSTVGGDWANAPNPVKYMGDTNSIYITNDPERAYGLAVENNADYIFVPNRAKFSGFGWEYGNQTKFYDERYFSQVYRNNDVTIFKVLS
ncbi:hypothetical protein CUJ83_10965 [Methanocella sp. CWC-04]|uniref:Uncharacterized protein n=1 Tax=Methanooceanicella nereidis TaxID=2052831 RepID=A0AAP2RFA5_9EURY|nr:hypothetical protein [Methanocella sp. CWC-04]MCD1295520.1 hypothetical protein [Methanocella sp. CWC-04]